MGSMDTEASQNAVPGGNLTKPVLIALGALLVGHMFSKAGDAVAQPAPEADETRSGGNLGGFLGKIFSQIQPQTQPPIQTEPVSAEMGGLGGLLQQLTQAGHGEKVNSWVNQGDNLPIAPEHLGEVLGQGKLADLARQAGISEQELLAQLSQALPTVVDQLTENGTMPNMQQLLKIFSPA